MSDFKPGNQYDYVFARGEGTKGASYKYSWRPDWRSPPGVKQSRVLFQVLAIMGLCAIPVWGLPYLRDPKSQEEKASSDMYAIMKKKTRDERLKWFKSDDMPYK